MKSVMVMLSVMLSLLFVMSEAWFLDYKSGKFDKSTKVTAAPNSRKVILVAKNVYVPMYADDDTTSSEVAGKLLPVSSVLTTSETVTNGRQQTMADYSSMFLQPPPASYAMYAVPSSAAAYAAPVQVPAADQGIAVPQQYAVYPAGYGAAGPQYVQYAAAPQISDGSWMMQYPLESAAPYSPTGNDKETVADGSSSSASIEAYKNA